MRRLPKVIKKNTTHQDYRDALRNNEQIYHAINTITSVCHELGSYELNKISLSCFDDKRYILADGQTSYAYGHYKIKKLTKLVATRPSQEGTPQTPYPSPPFSPVPFYSFFFVSHLWSLSTFYGFFVPLGLGLNQHFYCTSLWLLTILFRVVLSVIKALFNSLTPFLRFWPHWTFYKLT